MRLANALSISKKEIKENLRDRRTLFLAFAYSAVLFPLFLILQAVFTTRSSTIDYSAVSNVHVHGAEHAPDLVDQLTDNNIEVLQAPTDTVQALADGRVQAVLEIPPVYQNRLARGEPAPLLLHFNASIRASALRAQKLQQVIYQYGGGIRYERLQLKGIDPALASPYSIISRDTSTEGSSASLTSFLVYFLLTFTMNMGGFYIAVDTTAGERERGTLEPLLSLPNELWQVAFGKYLSILVFMLGTTALASLVLGSAIAWLPFEELATFRQLSGGRMGLVFLIMAPCCLFLAAAQLWLAGRAKGIKEAQAYLSIVLVLPMIPLGLSYWFGAKSSILHDFIPFLTQYRMIDQLANGKPIQLTVLGLGILGTVSVSIAALGLAVKTFGRERSFET